MLRLFIAISSSNKLEVNSIDTMDAFLQSEQIGCEVYLIPRVKADCDNNIA